MLASRQEAARESAAAGGERIAQRGRIAATGAATPGASATVSGDEDPLSEPFGSPGRRRVDASWISWPRSGTTGPRSTRRWDWLAAGDGLLLAGSRANGCPRRAFAHEHPAHGRRYSTLRAPDAGAAAALLRRMASAALDVPVYARKLRRAVNQFRPSVVHSNGIKMHLLAAGLGLRAPLVWHIRDFLGDRPVVTHALRLLAWRADAAIAISGAVADDTRRIMPRLPVSIRSRRDRHRRVRARG